jgi:pimeloyl-ACP methyl ester carboxylesterase
MRRLAPVLLGLVASLEIAVAQTATTPLGRFVDVAGRRVHLHCTGSGAPTVVIEAGASSFSIDFALIQPAIARSQRVCSYDRLGAGWSDLGAEIETPARVVTTLRRVLQTAGEKSPFILVGASRGGIFVRLYHLEYPDEVAGFVFIDPAHEDRLLTMLQGKLVPIASITAEELLSTMPTGPVPIARRSAQSGTPFDLLPAPLYKLRMVLEQRHLDSLPATISRELLVEFSEGDRAALARLKQTSASDVRPLGNRPVVVLSRGDDTNQERIGVHARIAALSTNSRHTVVPKAGHEIHLFQPEAVIAAVRDVTAAVRNRTSLPQR